MRDEMLGREPKDHDFLAAGQSHESIRAAVAEHGRVEDLVVAGRKVGVRLYPHGENFHVEITPPRKEVSTGPGHQDFDIVADPSVSVKEDLARRDFTVNAMARNLDTWELVDPYGGEADLKAGVLRTVTPDSFRDDPLRIVRGLRFVGTLGLTPDEQTHAQMTEHAAGIDHLSGERIQEQMDKLLMGAEPARALRVARDTGTLRHIYPELASSVGFGQESKFHDLTADEHTFLVTQHLADAGAPLHVRLAGLFHDSGKPEAAFRGEDGRLHYYGNPETGQHPHERIGRDKWLAVAKRHHYDTGTRDRVAALVEHHMWTTYDRPTDIRARRFLRAHGRERALDLIALKRADLGGKEAGEDARVVNSQARLDEFERRVREQVAAGHAFHRRQLKINGADLRALGFPEGKGIGATLDGLLDQVVGQPELNNREWLIGQAQKMLRKSDAKRSTGTLAHDVRYTPGVEATDFITRLPEGYTLRSPAALSKSSRSRAWTRDWHFALRDMYEAAGYGWTPYGSGHMDSGMMKALLSRGAIETAEHPRKRLLHKLTQTGASRLMQFMHDDNRPTPKLPEGAPGRYIAPMRELTGDDAYHEGMLVDELRAVDENLARYAARAADPEEAQWVDQEMWQRQKEHRSRLARSLAELRRAK